MSEDDILMINCNFGPSDNKQVTAYMQHIKQVIVSRFEDLAGEDVPPDFDKYSPDDLVIVARYKDGHTEIMSAGRQFTISL